MAEPDAASEGTLRAPGRHPRGADAARLRAADLGCRHTVLLGGLSNFSSFADLAPAVALAFFGEGPNPDEPSAANPPRNEASAPPPGLSHDLADYTGSYVSPELGTVYDLFLREGGLILERARREPTLLRVVGDDLFVAPDLGPLTFLRNESGDVIGFDAPTRVGSVAFERYRGVP